MFYKYATEGKTTQPIESNRPLTRIKKHLKQL